MGQRGPVPRRSTEKRAGHHAKAEEPDKPALPEPVKAPPADPRWGAAARRYYQSLIESGQAKYFEPTDWQQAAIVCELLTDQFKDSTIHERLLKEARALHRLLGKFLLTQDDETRVAILNDVRSVAQLISRLSSPPAASMMKEIFHAMADLGTTEGARRRMKIEVQRPDQEDDPDEFELPLKVVQGGRH